MSATGWDEVALSNFIVLASVREEALKLKRPLKEKGMEFGENDEMRQTHFHSGGESLACACS